MQRATAFITTVASFSFLMAAPAPAQTKQADYYRIVPIAIPDHVNLEAGAIESMPDGRLAVSTRRGDIYLVDGAFDDPPQPIFERYARGLHEVLGLAYRDGWLYATQRCEVTKLKDENGDGRANLVYTVSDDWGINGDYHEYAFGSDFDHDGNLWVVLCLTGSGGAADVSHFRGWAVRVTPDGKMIPTCSGIRSPGGIGLNIAGDVFYTDNQGLWNGTCGLKHLKPGSFQGNPSGNKYYALTDAIGPRPADPKDGSRIHVEAKRIPQLVPTAILFPYKKMGQSASGVVADTTGGKFGPFAGQVFVGDQTHSTVMRVFLEKVNGVYQGACFPFLGGVGSGTLSMRFTDDGSMFVGGTNRGWGSRGNKPYSLDRIVWTGKTPFAIHEMRVRQDGFELTFTEPIDPATATNVSSYQLSTYTYIYKSGYGSPEVDHTKPTIKRAVVASDGRSVRLMVDGLQIGHCHELHLAGLKSSKGLSLRHPVAYYTLNELPKDPAIAIAGQPYVLRDIAFNRQPDAKWQGRVHYRAVGQTPFQNVPLQAAVDGFFQATIPSSGTTQPFEFYAEFQEEGQPVSRFPLSGATSPIKVALDLTPPSAVAELGAENVNDYSLTLHWEAAKDDHGIAGYRIFRGKEKGFACDDNSAIVTVTDSVLQTVDDEPPSGKTAWYAVQALDIAGRNGEVAYLKIDVPANRPPVNKLTLTALAAGNQAYLKWSGDIEPDVVAIELLRGEGEQGELKSVHKVDDLTATSFVDKSLTKDATYRYAVRLVDRGKLISDASSPQLVRPGLYIRRVNCGGDAVTGSDGIPWEADKANRAGTGRFDVKKPVADGGEYPAIYQSERWSYNRLSYKFDVTPGRYVVILHFAETNKIYTVAGKRTFNVLINGKQAHANVDVAARVGADRAWQLPTTLDVSGKSIDIELRKAKAGPALKGLEIREVPAANGEANR